MSLNLQINPVVRPTLICVSPCLFAVCYGETEAPTQAEAVIFLLSGPGP